VREIVRNVQNEIEYYIDEHPDGSKEVRDKHGTLIGRIVNGQTRDRYGNLLSRTENVGLIMRGDR
jgi:hypothetical protein